MQSGNTYSIGPISVEFTEGGVNNTLLNDFSWLSPTSTEAELCINAIPNFAAVPENSIEMEDVYVKDSDVFIDQRGQSIGGVKGRVQDRLGLLGYQAHIHLDQGTTTLTLHYDEDLYTGQFRLLREYQKFQNWTYFNRYERVVKNILYNIFEPVLQIRLLASGCSFLHSSGVTFEDQTILFTGWGGAGKTSLSAELVRNEGYQIIGDDFTIVSEEGIMHPYLKSGVVYPYNVEHMRDPPEIFDSKIDRFQWWLKRRQGGPKNVRRRIKLDRFYGEENVNRDPKPISNVVYMLRANGDDFSHERADASDIARRASAVILHELSPFATEYLSAINNGTESWLSPEEIMSKSRNVFERSFDKVELHILHVPISADAEELAGYVLHNLLEGS